MYTVYFWNSAGEQVEQGKVFDSLDEAYEAASIGLCQVDIQEVTISDEWQTWTIERGETAE